MGFVCKSISLIETLSAYNALLLIDCIDSQPHNLSQSGRGRTRERESMCVCVHARVQRERERGRLI